MRLKTFFERLDKTLPWTLVPSKTNTQLIRAVSSDIAKLEGQCPIESLLGAKSRLDNCQAALTLDLWDIRSFIVFAADGYFEHPIHSPENIRELRQRLLDHLELKPKCSN